MINKIKFFFFWIISFFKQAARSTEAINVVLDTKKETEPVTVPPQVKQMEQTWFQRKNNLVEEFAYNPTPVYSSNFNSDEVIGWLMGDGTIIKNTDDEKDKQVILEQEKEELLEDDVDLLKKDIPVLPVSKTAEYHMGIDPYK